MLGCVGVTDRVWLLRSGRGAYTHDVMGDTVASPIPEQTAEGVSLSGLLGAYRPLEGVHDEAGLDGGLRPAWVQLAESFGDLPVAELQRRWSQAQRLIRENGVTYNVYGDPRGLDRPWQLDPIPLVLPQAEWEGLERALGQRALLLDLILQDLYGPQRLLGQGLLPPALVLGHPQFHRALHGVSVPGNVRLHLYAANLGRSVDGQWWVLADRTQSPSGAGYALENRIVLARTFPEAFRDCQVHRLAGFFHVMRQTLSSLSPRGGDAPRVVLLTPGAYNETYFEHAYLSRYLGYTLVEGGDLTVRGERVYLKTLGGLEPVDVILRRLDDSWCDPLELRSSSLLGVSGLVQAVRSGTVALANALGTGILETPAFCGFLPRLCEALLDEPLAIPSVASWWCGEPSAMDYALANVEKLVFKPAINPADSEPLFGSQLTTEQKQELVARVRARPHRWVAQEMIGLSSVPVHVDGRLEPRRCVLRGYLVRQDDHYVAMPGGMTRVSASADQLVVSLQHGGGSKDTWVLSDVPVPAFSLLSGPTSPVELQRGGGHLPSRVADNLFWLGRYAERAEGTARLVRAILTRLTSESMLSTTSALPVLLHAFVSPADDPQQLSLFSLAQQGEPSSELESELLAVVFDERLAWSLEATLNSLRSVSRIVRDRLSLDAWRALSRLDRVFKAGELHDDGSPADTLVLLDELIIVLSAFSGLGTETMTRSQGWRFMDIGRRIERATQSSLLLRRTLVQCDENDAALLEALLEVQASLMTYRSRYMTTLRFRPVLDLLLMDETNPRSVGFQLDQLALLVEKLPRPVSQAGLSDEQRLVLDLQTRVRLARIDDLHRSDALGIRTALEELLLSVEEMLPDLSNLLYRDYLALAGPSQQLNQLRIEGEP